MLESAIYRSFYMAVLFLAGLILANISLPSNFGALTLLFINAAIVSLVTGLGAESLVMHALANNKWSFGYAFSFLWKSLFFQLILFLLLQLIVTGLWNRTLLSQGSAGYFTVELIYFTGLVLTEKYVILFYSVHKATRANVLLIASAFFYLLLLGCLYYFLPLTLPVLFWIIALQSIAQGIILLVGFHIKEKNFFFQKINWKEVFKAFKVSSIVMFTNIIQLFAYRVDFWLIETYRSHYEVGIFAQANKFANLMWVVPNIFALLLIPKFGRISKQYIPLVFKVAVWSNIIIGAGTVIFSKVLYAWFLAPQYSRGITSFYIMLPGYFCWALVIYFGAFYSWSGKFVYNLVCSSFCLVSILALDLLLIPRYSLEGAALANTIAYSSTLVLYLFIFTRMSSYKLSDLLFFTVKKDDFTILQKALK